MKKYSIMSFTKEEQTRLGKAESAMFRIFVETNKACPPLPSLVTQLMSTAFEFGVKVGFKLSEKRLKGK